VSARRCGRWTRSARGRRPPPRAGRPAMQRAGTRTTGKGGQRAASSRKPHPMRRGRFSAWWWTSTLPSRRQRSRSASPRRALQRSWSRKAGARRTSRSTDGLREAASAASQPPSELPTMAWGPGSPRNSSSTMASIEEGVLRSKPSGPGVRSSRRTAMPSRESPSATARPLVEPGPEAKPCRYRITRPPCAAGAMYPKGDGRGVVRPGAPPDMAPLHRRCQWT
jgi:hypothetical protein